MANIKDLAEMAGVSVTTVSRVLNNHPYVSNRKEKLLKKRLKPRITKRIQMRSI